MQHGRFFVELSPVALKREEIPKCVTPLRHPRPKLPKLCLELIHDESSPDIPCQEELSSPIFNSKDVRIDYDTPLGHGGFGSVYESSVSDCDTVYAAKEIHVRDSQTHLVVSKESETQYKLAKNSDAFPKVICVSFTETSVIIVMEKITDSLLKKIQEPYWNNSTVVKDAILHLLRGAKEMHNQKIAHMDIKPENIGITYNADGSPSFKYLDFSADTSCVIDDNGLGSPGGYTLDYTSPEAFCSANTSEGIRCDLSDTWSIGCTILELITGIPPWAGLTKFQIYKQLSIGNHPHVPAIIREPFRDFILDCFKNVGERLSPGELLTKYHDVFA